MKRFARTCILAILLLVTSVAEVSAEPYRHPATGMVCPDQLADMDRGKVTDFEAEEPGLGVSIGYNAPGITLTIYLYNLALEPFPDSLESPAFAAHFKQTVDDVVQAGQLGYYVGLKKTAETAVSLTARHDGPKALCASFSYAQNGVERLSKLYLFPCRNHFLKVRFTCDRTLQHLAEDTLDQVLEYLAANVKE